MDTLLDSKEEVLRAQERARQLHDQAVYHMVKFFYTNELGFDEEAEFHFNQAKERQRLSRQLYLDAKNLYHVLEV